MAEWVTKTAMEGFSNSLARREVLGQPPRVLPIHQAVGDGVASYTVLANQDPERSRAVRLDFGDLASRRGAR